MILNEDQHTVLELLRVHLIQDDEEKHCKAIGIIEEIIINDSI